MLRKRSVSIIIVPLRRKQLLPPEQRGRPHRAVSVYDLPIRVHKALRTADKHPSAPNNELSGVQFTILMWLSLGKRPADVAEIMDMQANAVHQHIHKIKDKVGANTLAGLVAKAFRTGLIK